MLDGRADPVGVLPLLRVFGVDQLPMLRVRDSAHQESQPLPDRVEAERLVLLICLLVRPLGFPVPVGNGGGLCMVVGDPAVGKRIKVSEPDKSPEEDVVEAGRNVHVESGLYHEN